jgi:acetylornithine deacetylase
VAGAAAGDAWLAAHPPRVDWLFDIPAAEVDEAEAIVGVALGVTAAVGRVPRLAGLDSWHDGATLTRFAGTPAVALGPVGIEIAHTVDEQVAVDDLVACAQAYALAAVRFCGVA